MDNPMASAHNETHYNTRLKFRRFLGYKEPRPSENVFAKNCYPYLGTPLLSEHLIVIGQLSYALVASLLEGSV